MFHKRVQVWGVMLFSLSSVTGMDGAGVNLEQKGLENPRLSLVFPTFTLLQEANKGGDDILPDVPGFQGECAQTKVEKDALPTCASDGNKLNLTQPLKQPSLRIPCIFWGWS